mgnify:CR=1 FL=1
MGTSWTTGAWAASVWATGTWADLSPTLLVDDDVTTAFAQFLKTLSGDVTTDMRDTLYDYYNTMPSDATVLLARLLRRSS